MIDSLNVSTAPLHLSAGQSAEVELINGGPGTVYYKTTPDVSAASNDGSVAAGASTRFRSPQWFVSTTNTKVFLDHIEHERDTVEVHGFPDTSTIVDESNAHIAATTSVHGIANTSALATTADITTHNSDTTSVHGIGNTADVLVTLEAPINVKHAAYGAEGDGTTDDYAAIEAAIAAVRTAGGRGAIYLPRGAYRTTDTLDLDREGLTLFGDGVEGHLTAHTNSPTKIVADFTSGAAIRVSRRAVTIRGIEVGASATRTAAALSTNHGIHVESEDSAGASTSRGILDNVRVTAQPASGIVMVDNITNFTLRNVDVDNCGEHGILIASGVYTSRTNKTRPGQVIIDNCRTTRNVGNGLLIGGEGEDGSGEDSPYRTFITNHESFQNGTDSGVRYAACDSYISGENHVLEICAFGADGAKSALRLRGVDIKVSACRAINGDPRAVHIEDHPYLGTKDVRIEQLKVATAYATTYDPAVFTDAACQGVVVDFDEKLAAVTNAASNNSVDYWTYNNGLVKTNRTQTGVSGFKSMETTLTIADDAFKTILFSAVCNGMLLIHGNAATAGASLVYFRAGDASAHVTVLATDTAPNTVGTTGALNGTTGVDGDFTISAGTASNHLYFENRTGTSRKYNYTILNLDTGVTAGEMA